MPGLRVLHNCGQPPAWPHWVAPAAADRPCLCTIITMQYRHVILPTELARRVPHGALLSEDEWQALGVQQTPGWQHYLAHRPGELASRPWLAGRMRAEALGRPATRGALLARPLQHPSDAAAAPLALLRAEPHILLFRRPRGWCDPGVQAALARRPVPSWASATHPQVLAGQFQ